MDREHEKKSRGVKPHLRLKLRPGWSYDKAHNVFLAADGRRMPVGPDLPGGCRIEYTIPELEGADERKLTPDERNLVRHMQLVFSRGTDASRYLKAVAKWECVEDVSLPPEIGLPQ
jgi:hypothetical protein